MRNLILILLFLSLNCKTFLRHSKRYIISHEGIKARVGCTIDQFTISKFYFDQNNFDDIRPNNRNEITRYCCKLGKGKVGSSEISFINTDSNYDWFFCKLDMSIIENDSLNALPLQEKLSYLKKRELLEQINEKEIPKAAFPFIIQKGYVYQVFGLCGVEGSYFFCLDAQDKLIVQYQDKGPW